MTNCLLGFWLLWYEKKRETTSHQSILNVSFLQGNKAAVFPLQTLGFDVDNLNTVQFSNHTGKMWSDREQKNGMLIRFGQAILHGLGVE